MLVYLLHLCIFYYSNFFYFLNVFSCFEHILILMLFFFFKKSKINIFILPINSFFCSHTINFNLLNGIMNVHPCVYLLIYNNLLNMYLGFLKNKKISLNYAVIYFSTLLFLGGFWAAQELSWGGWWSWDITECTILYIYIYILYMSHTKIKNKFTEIFYLFIIIFILNKTNLIVSIHSFETTYDNNYIMFIFGVILLFFFLKKKRNFLFFIFLYTFNYMYLYISIYILYYIVFKKISNITFNFFNFFQFFSILTKSHFFFFFALFIYYTLYSYFYFLKYNNIFIVTEFYYFKEHFCFFNLNFTQSKTIFKNFFIFSLDFIFIFFKKLNFIICSFNFFIFFIFFLKKKKFF